jgi:hypothetical protein
MNVKAVCSIVTLLTLSNLVVTSSPGQADTLLCRVPKKDREQPSYGVTRQNLSQPVKGSGPEVFVVLDGKRRWITDSRSFDYYGFRYGDVKQLFDEEINRFPLGKPLSKNGTLLKSSGSEVYIIIDGTRRLVSAKVFDKHHFRFQNVNLVTDSNLLSIPEGPAFR